MYILQAVSKSDEELNEERKTELITRLKEAATKSQVN